MRIAMVIKASGLQMKLINITARAPVAKATGNPASKSTIREPNISMVISSILTLAPSR